MKSRLSDKQKFILKYVKIDVKLSSTPALMMNGEQTRTESDSKNVYYKIRESKIEHLNRDERQLNDSGSIKEEIIQNEINGTGDSENGEYEKQLDDHEDHEQDTVSVEGNETVNESHAPMRKIFEELRAQKETQEYQDHSDNSEDIKMFKEEIVYLNNKT